MNPLSVQPAIRFGHIQSPSQKTAHFGHKTDDVTISSQPASKPKLPTPRAAKLLRLLPKSLQLKAVRHFMHEGLDNLNKSQYELPTRFAEPKRQEAFRKAQDQLEMAVALLQKRKPDSADLVELHIRAQNGLGAIYTHQDKLAEARMLFENTLTLIKEKPQFIPQGVRKSVYWRPDARMGLARIALAEGKWDEAIEHLKRSGYTHEQYVNHQNLLGLAYLRKGEKQLALECFVASLEENGTSLAEYREYLYDGVKKLLPMYQDQALCRAKRTIGHMKELLNSGFHADPSNSWLLVLPESLRENWDHIEDLQAQMHPILKRLNEKLSDLPAQD